MSKIRMSLKGKTLVFLHIQKCAGNALIELLNDHFKPLDMLKAHLLHENASEIQRPVHEYKLIAGHNNLDDIAAFPIEPVYITMLRDPVDRVVSLYYFWRSHRREHIEKYNLEGPRLAKELSLEDFLISEQPVAKLNVNNGQARQFINGLRGPIKLSNKELLSKATERLEKLAFVGIQEHFDRSIQL